MENICIRFAGLDENSGALFLQFSKPEDAAIVEHATIHAFFPHQYQETSLEKLMPQMAAMGKMLLDQLQVNQQTQRQLSQVLVDEFSNLIGTNKTIAVEAIPSVLTGKSERNSIYGLSEDNTPKVLVDEVRCIILEILAEEGLIAGSVK